MRSAGSGPPDPESPAPEHEDDVVSPRPSAVDRLHAELTALSRELPELADDAEDASSQT